MEKRGGEDHSSNGDTSILKSDIYDARFWA